MYYLFFGFLFTVICGVKGAGNCFLNATQLHSLSLPGPTGFRERLIGIAEREIGVAEATGNNDGLRVEEYLKYTALGKGHDWCAAFVSWCYGQAGLAQPRNPWSPALFPKDRVYRNGGMLHRKLAKAQTKADVFGIYGTQAKRVNHVGLVKEIQGNYLISIEGNSRNRVECRRRHLKAIYVLADWLAEKEVK